MKTSFIGFKGKISTGENTMRPDNQMVTKKTRKSKYRKTFFQPDAGGATLKELATRDSKYVAPRRNGQGGRFQTDEVSL